MQLTTIIGCDETGVGDYFTPLVAAAVIIPLDKREEIFNLGVKDSKKITDKKILEIAPKIRSLLPHKISFLSQRQYNKINEHLNGNEMKMLLHLQNINYLENSHQVSATVIDKFSTTKSIESYIKKIINSSLQANEIKSFLLLEEKAEDKFLEVACASIIAREFLIQKMNEQNKRWNFEFPLGINSKVEMVGKEFVAEYGEEQLKEVAKLHFKTTKSILND